MTKLEQIGTLVKLEIAMAYSALVAVQRPPKLGTFGLRQSSTKFSVLGHFSYAKGPRL